MTSIRLSVEFHKSIDCLTSDLSDNKWLRKQEPINCRLKSKAVKVDRAINLSIATSMKAHLFISMGLLLAGIFFNAGYGSLNGAWIWLA